MVLDFDPKRHKLILSIKRTLPKPWEEFLKNYPVGSKVVGIVEKIEGVISQIKLFNAGSGWRTLTCVLVYVYALSLIHI